MPNGDKIKALYNAVSNDYNVGTLDEFTQKLQDPNKRQALYNTVGKEYDLGDYNSFNQKLGFDNKEVQQQQPTQQPLTQSQPNGFANAVNQYNVQHQGQQPNASNLGFDVAMQNPEAATKKIQQQQDQIKTAAENTIKKQNIINPAEKDKKVQDLIKASNKGDVSITQDAQGNDILKPTGNFLQSYSAAYKNAFQQQAQDAYLSNLPKDKAIEYLNQKQQHPELFTQEQDIAPTGISKMLGENANLLIKGTIGGIGGTALAPETGGASMGTFLGMAKDLASSGYSQALQKNYYRLKELHPEMSDSDIFDAAHQSALTGEAVSLGTGAILSGEIPKPTIPINGVTKAIENAAKTLPDVIKTAPKVIGSAMAGSVINDLKENDVTGGQGVNWDEMKKNLQDNGEQMAIMHFGLPALAAITNGGKSFLPSYVRPQIENVVASAPRDQVAQVYQNSEDNGSIPQGTTQKVLSTLSKFDQQKAVVNNLPIPEENKAAIAGKLVQKQDLLDEKTALKPNENALPKAVQNIDNKISGIDGEINKFYDAKNVFEKETDTNTGESNYQPKTFEELKPQEKNGIEVPKEYGDTEVKQSGEGDNKTFTAKAFYREPQGGLVIRRNIPIEENSFTDKDKAQQAADNALKQHYYENGLHDNAKPDKKIETQTQTEKPIEEGTLGSTAVNEPKGIPTVEGGKTEENVGTNLQSKQKEIPIVGEHNLKMGDKIVANLGNEKVDGTVTNVGKHKGQIVIDFKDKNGNDRFAYGHQIESLEHTKELSNITNEQKNRIKELINKDELSDDDLKELKYLTDLRDNKAPKQLEQPKENVGTVIQPKQEKVDLNKEEEIDAMRKLLTVGNKFKLDGQDVTVESYGGNGIKIVDKEGNPVKGILLTKYQLEQSETLSRLSYILHQNDLGHKIVTIEQPKENITENIQENGANKINDLEEQKYNKMKDDIKGETKLNLIPSKELVKAKEPIEAKKEHDAIKERYKTLKKLIDCI
jgi:hypothetical protein